MGTQEHADAENKINQVTVWPGKKKKELFSHSSVYKTKNLANKQEQLELLPDEHKLDLLGFIKESRGKSHLTGMAKFMVCPVEEQLSCGRGGEAA